MAFDYMAVEVTAEANSSILPFSISSSPALPLKFICAGHDLGAVDSTQAKQHIFSFKAGLLRWTSCICLGFVHSVHSHLPYYTYPVPKIIDLQRGAGETSEATLHRTRSWLCNRVQ